MNIQDKISYAKEWGAQTKLGQSTDQAFEIGGIAEDLALYDFQKSLLRNNEVDIKAPDFVMRDFPDIFVDAKTCRAYAFRNCARSFGRIEVAIECVQNMFPDYYGPEIRNNLREIRRLCLLVISESVKGQNTDAQKT